MSYAANLAVFLFAWTLGSSGRCISHFVQENPASSKLLACGSWNCNDACLSHTQARACPYAHAHTTHARAYTHTRARTHIRKHFCACNMQTHAHAHTWMPQLSVRTASQFLTEALVQSPNASVHCLDPSSAASSWRQAWLMPLAAC